MTALMPLLRKGTQSTPVDEAYFALLPPGTRDHGRDDVDFQKIDGKENLIDPFTKVLAIKEFDNHKSKMGIRYCIEWL